MHECSDSKCIDNLNHSVKQKSPQQNQSIQKLKNNHSHKTVVFIIPVMNNEKSWGMSLNSWELPKGWYVILTIGLYMLQTVYKGSNNSKNIYFAAKLCQRIFLSLYTWRLFYCRIKRFHCIFIKHSKLVIVKQLKIILSTTTWNKLMGARKA